MHERNNGWIRGSGNTEYLQYANARITRSGFPLGGYVYRVTKNSGDSASLYTGNDEAKARATATAT